MRLTEEGKEAHWQLSIPHFFFVSRLNLKSFHLLILRRLQISSLRAPRPRQIHPVYSCLALTGLFEPDNHPSGSPFVTSHPCYLTCATPSLGLGPGPRAILKGTCLPPIAAQAQGPLSTLILVTGTNSTSRQAITELPTLRYRAQNLPTGVARHPPKASSGRSSLRRSPGILRLTSSLPQSPYSAYSDRSQRTQILGR